MHADKTVWTPSAAQLSLSVGSFLSFFFLLVVLSPHDHVTVGVWPALLCVLFLMPLAAVCDVGVWSCFDLLSLLLLHA